MKNTSLWHVPVSAEVAYTRTMGFAHRHKVLGELLEYERWLTYSFPELPWVIDDAMRNAELKHYDHFYAYLTAMTFHLSANRLELPI